MTHTERPEDHPLYAVFMEAIRQAMYGKGERHGGAATPFLEQPWVHYAAMHGRGFLTGQAAKKLEEAASTRSGESFDAEMLGALVYCGMSVIHNRRSTHVTKQHSSDAQLRELEAGNPSAVRP